MVRAAYIINAAIYRQSCSGQNTFIKERVLYKKNAFSTLMGKYRSITLYDKKSKIKDKPGTQQ
jgi:hypothetical protein